LLGRLVGGIRPIIGLVDGLGIRGNIKALEALAELIPYVGQPMGLRKMINLLGLFRPSVGERRSIAVI
jgi:hypothetical protein